MPRGRQEELVIVDHNPHLGTKEDVVREHKKLVHKICQRYASLCSKVGCEYEDLVNTGFIGLLKAFNNYDPTKFEGVTRFSTYAVPMIIGEIQRFIRDNNLGVKYSRSIKELYRRIVKEDLLNEDPAVIAEKLGATRDSVLHALEYDGGTPPASLQEAFYEDKDGDEITIEDHVPVFADFTGLDVEGFYEILTENERIVLKGRINDWPQRQIGELIGVSQVQVSRIEKHIRKKAKDYFGVDFAINRRKGNNTMGREVVNKEAVEECKRLLRETNLSYREIAEKTGLKVPLVTYYARTHRPGYGTKQRRREEAPVIIRQMTDEERERYGLKPASTEQPIPTDTSHAEEQAAPTVETPEPVVEKTEPTEQQELEYKPSAPTIEVKPPLNLDPEEELVANVLESQLEAEKDTKGKSVMKLFVTGHELDKDSLMKEFSNLLEMVTASRKTNISFGLLLRME